MDKKIALFDMDDTLCDFSGQLMRDLRKVYSNEELGGINFYNSRIPKEMRDQMKKIRESEGWWRNLPFLEDGMGLWQYMLGLGFDNSIATKGPYKEASAWTQKREWQKIFLPDSKLFITDDKSLIRGDVLVDDWPIYVDKWLDVNRDGVAILPKRDYNANFTHERAMFYDGQNFSSIDDFLSDNHLF